MNNLSVVSFLTQVLNPKIFIATMAVFLIGGSAAIYWYNSIVNAIPVTPSLQISQPVTQEPYSLKFDLSSPDDNALVFDSALLVSGKASPESVVIISQNDTDFFIKSDQDGNFSQTIKLAEGINSLVVGAYDSQGNSDQQNRTVYYSKEKL